MDKILIIYDNTGFVISQTGGDAREPVGVPFMWLNIHGKRLKIDAITGIGIDVTVTPHEAILEDIPKTETELLQNQINSLNLAIADMMGV